MTEPATTPDRLTEAERQAYNDGLWTQPRKPLPRKRSKPRRTPDLTCSIRTCHYPPRVFQWCAKHAKLEADKLFAKYVKQRDRYCQLKTCGTDYDLQAAHVFSRGYFATRWDPANCVTLCSGHHVWFTHHPIEWEDRCIERMGREVWDTLRSKARAGGMPDVALTISALRTLLEELVA